MIQRRPQRSDAGMSLVELLVTMTLLGVVSALVLAGVQQASRVFIQTDDENRGLGDAKIVLDRLSRDIREARAVVCDGGLADPNDETSADPDCAAHLQLWIDNNSNYLQDDDEVVTWWLERNADGVHFDVLRQSSGEAQPKTIASALIVRTLFEYNTPGDPENANLVTVKMTYDAMSELGVAERKATVSVRLRNKG